MKYGLNLLLWSSGVDESIFPTLDNIKDWGYDGVELPVFDMDEAAYKKIGAKLDELEFGRTAVTVCTPEENPISEDAKIREAGVNRLKKAIDMCAAAGCTHLLGPIHSALGHFVGRGRTADEWKWGQESLALAADYAQANDVMLVVEYLNRFECYYLNSAEETSRFTREVNHPNLKMMYDTFHANIEEKSIGDAIRTCADQMVHVHISENDRSTPGEGGVNWDETWKTLKEVNYDGWLMIEAFGLALPELAAATCIWRRMFSTEEHLAKEGLKFMKAAMEG